jgi:dipeptidyl aminopeptidase/acylaminoacyl peptidase
MTIETRTMPFGTWGSPITADLIVSNTVGLDQIVLDGGNIYWLESRPAESGRNVIVRQRRDGQSSEINPPPYNVRTLVHEMGGGAYAVADDTVYFCNYRDQRLYCLGPADSEPLPLTADDEMRFADGVVDRRRRRLVVVREDHTQRAGEPVNTLISLSLDGASDLLTLAAGSDFYASPRLSPDGDRLAWLSWRHPNMPWDGTELWLGTLDETGAITHAEQVAGGASESVFQPEWSPRGVLHFVSDRSGWWNLYRWQQGRTQALAPRQAEFGLPQWIFGMSTYGFASADRIICCFSKRGLWHLAELDTTAGTLWEIGTPYTEITSLRVSADQAAFIGAAPSEGPAVIRLDLKTRRCEVLRRSGETRIDPGYLSLPEPIEFPTERGLTAHAFFYPPCNHDYTAPPGDKPPLRVLSHGGPTSATGSGLNPAIQFWTSRGVAVLDVNYGGSTGYGRAYRERLCGNWGIVDVDDCVNGALYLIARGDVDPRRLAIKGGSAGGYTTLSALTFRDVFKAGASYYGIGDLEALARDTHKFESRYMDRLIGPYPERRDRYVGRSPIHFVDRLSCPIIFLQGLEDRIVPPNQSEMMVQALRDKGLPVAYVAFAGEQHGFRRAENIKRALEAELFFYSRVFGFEPADALEPVPIENL